jgi:hypothetical protein
LFSPLFLSYYEDFKQVLRKSILSTRYRATGSKIKQENNGITLRLVKVVLPSGEIEVLATSLIDEQKFKTERFKELYFLRWGVETFFAKLKGRLSLGNFTGKSVESVKQDFWLSILISNLESIMTEDVEEALDMGLTDDKLKKSINKSVSFNAIKTWLSTFLLRNQTLIALWINYQNYF